MARQVVKIVVHVGHPVASEKMPVLACYRSLEAQHRIHPGRVVSADQNPRLFAAPSFGAHPCAEVWVNDSVGKNRVRPPTGNEARSRCSN